MLKLTLFDLDHTLLDGDSDVLWVEFLIGEGVLDAQEFATRNADVERRYRAGAISAAEFSSFFVSTLAGRAPEAWHALRRTYFERSILPRIPRSASELVQTHRSAGDLLILTTATNRFLTELTAQHLGFEHLIATEPELEHGCFTGRTTGTLNMKEGKVVRLQHWLGARGLALADCESRFYSDSINDLPLLSAVRHAVAVDPDASLAAAAAERGWPVISLLGAV